MRAILATGLVLSLALNAWLLTAPKAAPTKEVVRETVQASVVPAPTRAAPRAAAAAPSASETEELKARVAELEKSLAAANEKAAELDAIDPVALVVYSQRPVAWKARKVAEIADERQRLTAMGKLSQVLSEKETSGRELLEALKSETDPRAVAMLGMLVRNSLGKTPAEDRRAFLDLLRTAPLAETRAAASNALFMPEGIHGVGDEAKRKLAREMNGYLVEALRNDASPEVAGQIAQNFGAWFSPPEVMEALKSASERLPASPGRRKVWEAIARGSRLGQSTDLFPQFEAATAQDVKDDIAAGMARAGNSTSGGGRGDPAKRMEEARTRFRIVFSGTSDVTVRKSLVRAACYGIGCIDGSLLTTDEQRADAARFLREVASLEPDATQRERIEKVAAAFEKKGNVEGSSAYQDLDRIMSGKE